MKKYEAIVVGGGHAGVEAIFALANKGHKVLLATLDKTKVAMMPCNPSIGGSAKGIITREIDALGGMQGFFSDKAMIQIKTMNESKGPAVRSLRAQIDKIQYSKVALKTIKKHKNIDIVEGVVDNIETQNNKIIGITLENGSFIESKIVIITTGTYMGSCIWRGSTKQKNDLNGEKNTSKISKSLENMGLRLFKLKTGTSPRILASSIDFSQVKKEILNNNSNCFSSRSGVKLKKQAHCYLTYTNEKTHKIVENNIKKSSMYSGAINGIGPRYCPSIEDKIVRFKDKSRHQIFFEPETRKGDTIYINGLSTSMPINVQKEMVKTIPGLKNAKVLKWGYAIEYDVIDPLQITNSLETKKISGLFTAGQVNGTSGYEEAAAQGLIAGINAALKIENKKSIILRRDQSYIGVLIDDLITKGTKEPYRMLTSRAEYRLLLRNDNADIRLAKVAFNVGLITKKNYDQITYKYKKIHDFIQEQKNKHLSSKDPLAIKYNITNGSSLYNILSRPEIDINDFSNFEYIYEASIQIRLDGYIKKQNKEAKRMIKLEKFKLPIDINYAQIENIATEAKIKLEKIRPATIGQASRISGVNISDVQMIMFWLEYRKKGEYKKVD